MKRIFICLFAILASWSALGQDTAIRYYPTYLGSLYGSPVQATAMNNSGQVCGNPPFIYTAGVIQDLSQAPIAEYPVSPDGDPPLYFGPALTATSINDEGLVVGYAFEDWSVLYDDYGDYFYTGESAYPAYLYSDGAIYDLGYDISDFTIGLYEPPTYTVPLCISDRDNEIIANGPSGPMYRFGFPMAWDTDISVINPLWLNNQGHMAGWLADQTGPTNADGYIYIHACLANFSTQDLGTLGGSNSLALCLNASDQVVGWSLNNNEVQHAFFWSGGTMTDIGTLGGATNDTSIANFINVSGQVVGTSTINSGQTSRAFLYTNGTMVDLNTLIVNILGGLVFTNATAINDSGQIISGSYLLTPFAVSTNVNVQFTATPTNGSSLLSVQFTSPSVDSGGYAITSWNWIFGDGSTSTLQNPVHTYTNGGNFTPILLATNVNNSPMLGQGPSTITVTNPAIQFTASKTNGAAPLAVQFNCSSNDTAGYSISSWQWDFGDGATTNLQNPLHVYKDIGTFNAVVTGTNSYGNQVIGSASITVINSVVHFTANPAKGTWPLAVQFSCPGVDSAGSSITVWQWNFGDGATSTLQNPSHIYTKAGTFSPVLLATNNIANAVIASGPSITVTNPATQWSLSEASPPSQNSGVPWSSLAISGDGNTLIAADSDRANFGFGPPEPYGLVYSSTNNGASWGESLSTLGSDYSIGSVAASANGSKLFATGSEGGIDASTNSGATWASVQPLGGPIFSSIQSSADGNELLGVTTQNGLYLSTNSGNSLTNVLALSIAPPISLSPNGSNLFIWNSLNNEFFRSPQTNWWMFTNSSSFNGWIPTSLNATSISALASSYDGSRVVAVGSGVYASTNSGATWSTNISPITSSWTEVASSWDGMRIEIGGSGGLYNSADGGNTWQSNSSPVSISQICCSSNATTLAGIGSDGAIYVFRNPIVTVPPEAPLSAAVARGANFSFSCALVTGHTYQTQSIGTLTSTNWLNLGAPFVATNSSMSISDVITNTARFYRVKLVQ